MRVNAIANALRRDPFTGLVDIVPAYASLTVLYSVVIVKKALPKEGSITNYIQRHIEKLMHQYGDASEENKPPIEIPVCYDASLSTDLGDICQLTHLPVDDIIRIHSTPQYYVHMLGFLPGFAYMGKVDKRIAVDRKNKPVNVQAGAVGIAGRQTGIYPVTSPGGWQIVGYTPIKMFDSHAAIPCRLNAGDTVKFIAISLEEYHALRNKQLA